MPSLFDKIFLSLGFILFLTLFIGTRAGLAIDAAYPNRLLVSQFIYSLIEMNNDEILAIK